MNRPKDLNIKCVALSYILGLANYLDLGLKHKKSHFKATKTSFMTTLPTSKLILLYYVLT